MITTLWEGGRGREEEGVGVRKVGEGEQAEGRQRAGRGGRGAREGEEGEGEG